VNKITFLNVWSIVVPIFLAIFLIALYYWLRRKNFSKTKFALIYSLVIFALTLIIIIILGVSSFILTKNIESIEWIIPLLICILPQFLIIFVGVYIQLTYGELFEKGIDGIRKRHLENIENRKD